MYLAAILGDIASLVPGLNVVTGIITGIVLGIIGSGEGISLYSDSEILGTLLTFVGEEIPFASILPLWTIRVWLAKRAKRARDAQAE